MLHIFVAHKALSTLETIVADFGDYSLQCGQDLSQINTGWGIVPIGSSLDGSAMQNEPHGQNVGLRFEPLGPQKVDPICGSH